MFLWTHFSYEAVFRSCVKLSVKWYRSRCLCSAIICCCSFHSPPILSKAFIVFNYKKNAHLLIQNNIKFLTDYVFMRLFGFVIVYTDSFSSSKRKIRYSPKKPPALMLNTQIIYVCMSQPLCVQCIFDFLFAMCDERRRVCQHKGSYYHCCCFSFIFIPLFKCSRAT